MDTRFEMYKKTLNSLPSQGGTWISPPIRATIPGRMETKGNPNFLSPQSGGLASIIILGDRWVTHAQGKCDSS